MRVEKRYYVYIMASRSLNLYTGVTNDIFDRTLDHKQGLIDGFTKRYKINRLVYFETFRYIGNAINREKQIKSWSRAKKIALVKSTSPTWIDLAEDWGKPIKLQIPHSARDDKVWGIWSAGMEDEECGLTASGRYRDAAAGRISSTSILVG